MKYDPNVFDKNKEFYGRKKSSWHDYYFLEFIKQHKTTNASLLDVGCGSGIFPILVRDMDPSIEITVIDPSSELLNKISCDFINKKIGSLPNNLCLDSDLRFGYIHLREVIHHIVGQSVKDSQEMAKESLVVLNSHLDDDGYIMIHELFFEGYLIPNFPRSLIFSLLKLQNDMEVKIPFKEFLLGLQVCFYTREEFCSLLASCGYEILEHKLDYWESNWKKNTLMIKDWGRMMIIAKRK